jgi:flagellar motor switch protein FliG
MINHKLRKAAILVAALDAKTADQLLEQMSPEQQALVRRLVVELGDVSAGEQQAVIDEFVGLGAPAATMDPYQDTPPFRFLHRAPGDKLTRILAGEHPQTIALVLSHLPADQAGDVLAILTGALQADVIRRLVELDEADPETLREVERGLQSRIFEHTRYEQRRRAGVQAVTGILAAADPRVKRNILTNLAAHDHELAEQFTRQVFEFVDLVHASDAALGEVLRTADVDIVMLAFADASPALLDRMLGLLPVQDAKLLRRALESLGPTRLSDVAEAQRELARLARRLEAQGRLTLPRGRRAEVAAA